METRKQAFKALQDLKKAVVGANLDLAHERSFWRILDNAIAEYVAPAKVRGPWIEVWQVFAVRNTYWRYVVRRRNGKGTLKSCVYTRRASCVWMAKRTAKQLGVEYRETKD